MNTVRVATYNIHKGVQGLGPRRRLEIHNLGHAVEQFDADIVCLQEVRKLHRVEERHFPHWPDLPQANYLAPEGYEVVYRTNALTRHGEHGNAVLSRWPVSAHQHEDISDEREIPSSAPLLVAGDFNDWGTLVEQALAQTGLRSFMGDNQLTFPARLPLVQLDYVYARGLTLLGAYVPRGRIWWRMSDHLPLIAEFALPVQA